MVNLINVVKCMQVSFNDHVLILILLKSTHVILVNLTLVHERIRVLSLVLLHLMQTTHTLPSILESLRIHRVLTEAPQLRPGTSCLFGHRLCLR